MQCLQTQVTSIYKTCAHACVDFDYQWTMKFHAQLCQDIKEGLSNGMWQPHTQAPDSHCNLSVSMARPCMLCPRPCRQNFGHHAVTLLLTSLYFVTVAMVLICVHMVLLYIILHWHREGLIHNYQPSASLHLKKWSLRTRLWDCMSHLKWGHNLLNGVLNGIQILNFWILFICRKHIWTQYCLNKVSRATAYTCSQAVSLWKIYCD